LEGKKLQAEKSLYQKKIPSHFRKKKTIIAEFAAEESFKRTF